MSSETFTYKGISGGKYVEGDIEALNQEEASFKLKEKKIIITNLVRSKKIKERIKINYSNFYKISIKKGGKNAPSIFLVKY